MKDIDRIRWENMMALIHVVHHLGAYLEKRKNGSSGGEPPMDELTKKVSEMDVRLARMEGTLPHLATKAEMYVAIGAALTSAATGILTLIGAVIGLLKAFGHL